MNKPTDTLNNPHSQNIGTMILRKIANGGLLIFLVGLVLVFSVLSPYFFSINNFMNILQSVSVIGITAAGMMMVIISAGIDLSAGAQMAFIGCVQTQIVIKMGIPWYLGILLGMGIGMLCGLLNGVLVTYGGFVPFIASLGTMNIVRGMAYIISNGQSTYLSSRQLEWFGIGRVFGIIPVPVVLFLVSFLIVWAVLKFTVFGRYVYSIGGNPTASHLAGINVKKYTLLLYVITGFLASVSGLVLLGMAGSSVPSAGETYGTDIVTAVLLGGASLKGGKGNIVSTFVGVIVIGIMNNGMTLVNVPQYWQILAKGLLMILAVGLDKLREVVGSNQIV